jgi:hypothetical protein
MDRQFDSSIRLLKNKFVEKGLKQAKRYDIMNKSREGVVCAAYCVASQHTDHESGLACLN